MDTIRATCPVCGCPHWNGHGMRTADVGHAWRDTDGTWYQGPAEASETRSCGHCGWTQRIVRKRGKLVSVESDPIPSHPSPAPDQGETP
jgi:hypothetical protein